MFDNLDLLSDQPQQPQPQPDTRKPARKKDNEQPATVNECHPDMWDENGRLISNVLITPAK